MGKYRSIMEGYWWTECIMGNVYLNSWELCFSTKKRINKMNWLKKGSTIPRWKFILWSITCILYGCFILLIVWIKIYLSCGTFNITWRFADFIIKRWMVWYIVQTFLFCPKVLSWTLIKLLKTNSYSILISKRPCLDFMVGGLCV